MFKEVSVFLFIVSVELALTVVLQAEASSVMDGLIHGDDRYDMLLAVKELACRGMAAEVVEEINVLDPNFFSQNPDLLFQLKQVPISLQLFAIGCKRDLIE